MIPETIFSASAGEEKNGRSVEFVRLLVVETAFIVFSLVRF
jgi:hypothetical protein